MDRMSIEKCVLVVKTFYQSNESSAETAQRLRTLVGWDATPNVSSIRRLMKKFAETGSTVDIKSPRRPCKQRSVQNIVAVQETLTSVQ